MTDLDGIKDEMLRVAGISEVWCGQFTGAALAFGPGALVPVDGDPAEQLVPVWRRGDKVAYARPWQLRAVGPDIDAPRRDSVLAARWDYVHGAIDIVEFERRVWAVITREGEAG